VIRFRGLIQGGQRVHPGHDAGRVRWNRALPRPRSGQGRSARPRLLEPEGRPGTRDGTDPEEGPRCVEREGEGRRPSLNVTAVLTKPPEHPSSSDTGGDVYSRGRIVSPGPIAGRLASTLPDPSGKSRWTAAGSVPRPFSVCAGTVLMSRNSVARASTEDSRAAHDDNPRTRTPALPSRSAPWIHGIETWTKSPEE